MKSFVNAFNLESESDIETDHGNGEDTVVLIWDQSCQSFQSFEATGYITIKVHLMSWY